MSGHLLETVEPPAKRRKVRKGTRSCWECRRRKIKCQFDSPDDAVCIGCKQRGTACRSQEYDDDNAPEPGQKPDPPIARRLDRLEQMMERLVDRIVPDNSPNSRPGSSQQREPRRSHSGSPPDDHRRKRRESSEDITGAAAASEGPIAALLALRRESVQWLGPSDSSHILTPALTSAEPSTPVLQTSALLPGSESRPTMTKSVGGQALPFLQKSFWICNTLRTILPAQPALDAIISASPGASYVVTLCHSEAERVDGRTEPVSSLAIIPPTSAHPLRLAKRALQILICIQQLPSTFDWESLNVGASMVEMQSRLLITSMLVTTNDDLIGYAEGIECLLIQAYYQADGGNLRKAWAAARRGLSLAQVMGIDKGHSAAFRSCDSGAKDYHRSSAHALWYKLVCLERSLSLLLGLSVGSPGNDFASDRPGEHDHAFDRLEKAHAVLAERISARNDCSRVNAARQQASYALTQEIDLELEAAAKTMPSGWWEDLQVVTPEAPRDATTRVVLQIHHFNLNLLLHVPYMMRDLSSPRYDYSKTACVTASRDLLRRFSTLRARLDASPVQGYYRVDYAALLAAMTLCLSYLARRRTEVWDIDVVREDVAVVDLTRRHMEHVARVKGDHLARAAVNVIDQLTPIIDVAAAALEEKHSATIETRSETESPMAGTRGPRFSVPYLGAIDIRIPRRLGARSSSSKNAPVDRQSDEHHHHHHHRRHPSSATGALERMAITSSPPSLSPDHHPPRHVDQLSAPDTSILPKAITGEILQLTPYDDQAPFGTGADVGVEPEIMSGRDDWALQGVDAAYWSLLKVTW